MGLKTRTIMSTEFKAVDAFLLNENHQENFLEISAYTFMANLFGEKKPELLFTNLVCQTVL